MKLTARKDTRRSSMQCTYTSSKDWFRFRKESPYYFSGTYCVMKFGDRTCLYEVTEKGRVFFFGDRTKYRDKPCRVSYALHNPWSTYEGLYLIEVKMPKVAKRLEFNWQDYGYFKLRDGLDRIKKQYKRLKEIK